MKKKLSVFALIMIVLVMVVGCTPGTVERVEVPGVSLQFSVPGPNPLSNTADANNNTAGVLLGIWHGAISPLTLTLSFINPDLQMYEVHNDGGPYNLGFLLGVAIVFGVLGAFIASRRR